MSGRGRGRGRAEAQSASSRCATQTDSAAQKRLAFDYAELESKPYFSEQNFVGDSMMDFVVRIKPDAGIWADRNFDFYFHISEKFPNKAPTVKLLTKIWHPNIDINGDVCLSVLRKDWKPTHTIGFVINCLPYLFKFPNAGDPLNMAAADDYLEDEEHHTTFIQKAQEYMDKYCPADDAPLTKPDI